MAKWYSGFVLFYFATCGAFAFADDVILPQSKALAPKDVAMLSAGAALDWAKRCALAKNDPTIFASVKPKAIEYFLKGGYSHAEALTITDKMMSLNPVFPKVKSPFFVCFMFEQVMGLPHGTIVTLDQNGPSP
jgi:hypothetical protein